MTEFQNWQFPDEWLLTPLQDCMEAIIDYRGKSPRKSPYGVPLVTAKIVRDGRIDFDGGREEFIPESDYDEWMRRGIPCAGDIVMTTEAPLGEVAQLDGRKVALAQRLITLRGRQDTLDNSYLRYLMQGEFVQQQLLARASGTTVVGIRQSELRQVLLPLPPLPIQQRIAEILGRLDDKIEVNRRINRTLEEMAQALYKHWFVDFGPFQDGPFVESELGMIPEGWEVKSFGALCHKPQYGYTESAREKPIGPKFLRIADINKTPWIEWHTVPHCPIDTMAYEKYRVREGDILIARMADPGHGVLIEHDINAVFASYLIRFVPFEQEYNRFIQYWIRSQTYWNLVESRKAGTTRANLNAKQLSTFPVVVPPLNTAREFGESVGRFRNVVNHNVAENQKLAAIRDYLLPRLLSGEVSVGIERERFI